MQLWQLKARRLSLRMALLTGILVLSCSLASSLPVNSLERVRNQGVLRMATLTGPTTYYRSTRGEDGFEYQLAKSFAEYLGVRLQVITGRDLNATLLTLAGPQADFAGANLTVTTERSKWLKFSVPYDEDRSVLIYRRGTRKPRTLDQIDPDKRLVIMAGSSHESQLSRLQATLNPQLNWEALDNSEMLHLMQLVHDGDADYAVIDASAYSINRSIYPKARLAFYLSEPEPIAWAFPSHADESLILAANQFLEEYRTDGRLRRLKERFYSATDAFSLGGSQLFISRVNKLLPIYEDLFRQTADQYGVDWHLLAAIAYQESHWDPLARSPTGVRGFMMLTQDTAREVGVSDLFDPEQSLRGGVEYYLKIKKRLPESIQEPDRTWFALAAYNVGLGHLEDGRVLTERAGENPDLWDSVKKHLPLLRQRKYYKTVRYGFARGDEPVNYVKKIRHFRTILHWHTQEQARILRAEMDAIKSDLSSSTLAPL